MHPREVAIKRLASNVDCAYKAADAATMASYWTEDGLNINHSATGSWAGR